MKIIYLLLMVFLSSTWAKTKENLTKPPNIVVIMADDMGIDDVSFHGAKQHITPNIDAIAYYGMNLQNYYTPPMCTPSRSAFMTGKYPIRTGMQHYVISNETPWGMPTNVTTIAEIFRDANYSTNLIGKWHLGFARKSWYPTNRGFDSFYGYMGGYVDYYQRRSLMPVVNTSMGYDFRRNLDIECADRGTYLTDLFTREAEAVIAGHNEAKPLFLVVNHLAPHTGNEDIPLQAPQENIDKFDHITDERRRIYAAMVDKLDESVGKIIKALDEKDILDNTILIFYSDNGAPSIGKFANTGSNWPMRGQKNTPWEGGIRVAAAIWSPLLKTKRKVFRQNMYVGDWLPTLARAANIELSSNLELDGLDVWEELSYGGAETFDREIVHVLDDIWGVASYLSGSYKYINGTTLNGFASDVVTSRAVGEDDPRNANYAQWILESNAGKTFAKYDKNPLIKQKIDSLRRAGEVKCNKVKNKAGCNPMVEECLFNIERDPCEQNNLARNARFASIVAEMRKEVESFRLAAVPPAIVPGLAEGDPTRHSCTWTWFMDEPPSENIEVCGNTRLPCQDS